LSRGPLTSGRAQKGIPIGNPSEEQFVNIFVQTNRRVRCLFELGSPKRRRDFLNRLCHDYETVFDERYLVELAKPNSDVEALEKILTPNGAGKICRVISFCEELDGKEMNLSEALRLSIGYGFPSVLICTPSLAYFEAEQLQGPPPRFILRKK